MKEKRLVRSRHERICCGVAGGIAEYLNVDPALVRIFFVLTTILCGGLGLLLYAILWILMPEEKANSKLESVGG